MAERRAVDAQPLAALVDLIVVRWEVLLHRPPDRPEPAEAPPDAQPEVGHLAQGLQGLGRKRSGLAALAALALGLGLGVGVGEGVGVGVGLGLGLGLG